MMYLAIGAGFFCAATIWALACEMVAECLIERANGRALKGWLRR